MRLSFCWTLLLCVLGGFALADEPGDEPSPESETDPVNLRRRVGIVFQDPDDQLFSGTREGGGFTLQQIDPISGVVSDLGANARRIEAFQGEFNSYGDMP